MRSGSHAAATFHDKPRGTNPCNSYLNESRASDSYSLPDAEVFYRTDTALAADDWRDSDGDVMKAGWYAWVCFPGCLPESDPCGPFASQEEAVKYARDLYGDDDDDSPDVA